MGEVPLSYQDLLAWEQIGGVKLMPWEARLLRTLSTEYLIERQKAEELGRPAPFTGEADDIATKRSLVARQVQAAFGQLKRKG